MVSLYFVRSIVSASCQNGFYIGEIYELKSIGTQKIVCQHIDSYGDSMSLRTCSFALGLRDVGRTLGINKLVNTYLLGRGYETKYQDMFFAELQSGDCVWDIGANIGHYTQLFSHRVGSQGGVFAFEPSPSNFSRLSHACAELKNTTLLPFGLGLENKPYYFQQGADDLGATSRIIDDDVDGILVDIKTAASVIDLGEARSPTVIKIDVEGFEYDVLQGLSDHLKSSELRLIGIEVHFGILKERSLSKVPQKIEKLLMHCGFLVCWPDSSHIIAKRMPVDVKQNDLQ